MQKCILTELIEMRYMEKDYLECNLPVWLRESIVTYGNGKNSSIWNCLYCELQSDINVAEQEQLIATEQAWFLRKKYLGLSNNQEMDI